jgi:hypothetical protein
LEAGTNVVLLDDLVSKEVPVLEAENVRARAPLDPRRKHGGAEMQQTDGEKGDGDDPSTRRRFRGDEDGHSCGHRGAQELAQPDATASPSQEMAQHDASLAASRT